MLFNSWGYLLFLGCAVALHWCLPQRARIALLGLASVLFYAMWRWEFAFLILFSAALDFVCARRIAASQRTRARKAWLATSLALNLGLLVFFKYSYFLYENLLGLAAWSGLGSGLGSELGFEILLPLGISFYTFQTISYSIDVYRGVIAPTPHFSLFLTYVTFWPQLIAGPILRAGEVIPQLAQPRRLRARDVSTGLQEILFGLVKKVVIADSIAPLVEAAFATDPAVMNATDVWVAAFLFGFQIYFDFSGYSQIAIGSARLVGLDFPANFDWPYMARSPREFWNRWHRSLSSWIRDYLYLPMLGARAGVDSRSGLGVATRDQGRQRNPALFLTWFIMGLWHGAAWTFALWGVYHACLVYVFRKSRRLQALADGAPGLSWALTLASVMLGWIPFRAQSLEGALQLFAKLFDPRAYNPLDHALNGHAYWIAPTLLLGMAALYPLDRWVRRQDISPWVAVPALGAAVGVSVFALLMLLRPVEQFIYFQF